MSELPTRLHQDGFEWATNWAWKVTHRDGSVGYWWPHERHAVKHLVGTYRSDVHCTVVSFEG